MDPVAWQEQPAVRAFTTPPGSSNCHDAGSARDISPRINIREPDILLHKCLHIVQSLVVEKFAFARSMKQHPLHCFEAAVCTGNTAPLLQLWLASFLFIRQSMSDVWLAFALQYNNCPLNAYKHSQLVGR